MKCELKYIMHEFKGGAKAASIGGTVSVTIGSIIALLILNYLGLTLIYYIILVFLWVRYYRYVQNKCRESKIPKEI